MHTFEKNHENEYSEIQNELMMSNCKTQELQSQLDQLQYSYNQLQKRHRDTKKQMEEDLFSAENEIARLKFINKILEEGDFKIFKKNMERLIKTNEELNEDIERKRKHQIVLEDKIHRMRDNIKRLEVLYHYREQEGSFDLKKECWELKQENGRLKSENTNFKLTKQELQSQLDQLQYSYNQLQKQNKVLRRLGEYDEK